MINLIVEYIPHVAMMYNSLGLWEFGDGPIVKIPHGYPNGNVNITIGRVLLFVTINLPISDMVCYHGNLSCRTGSACMDIESYICNTNYNHMESSGLWSYVCAW